MKTVYPVAGAVLLAGAIFLAVKQSPGEEGESLQRSAGGANAEPGGRTAPSMRPRPAPRSPGVRVDEIPPAARELELLWARGRAAELRPAQDRLSSQADSERWGQVAPVLVEQAAKEGRPDVATYLLATGDAAPAGIRAEIYAAALGNPDEGNRDAARLELQNITGEIFDFSAAARDWLGAHPRTGGKDEESQ